MILSSEEFHCTSAQAPHKPVTTQPLSPGSGAPVSPTPLSQPGRLSTPLPAIMGQGSAGGLGAPGWGHRGSGLSLLASFNKLGAGHCRGRHCHRHSCCRCHHGCIVLDLFPGPARCPLQVVGGETLTQLPAGREARDDTS